jgi:putative ATP-binding cassette transporter
MKSGMMIAAYSNILLDMSKKVKVDFTAPLIGPVQFQGNGYFLWSAMGMAVVAGLTAYALGRPLIKQTQEQETLNANFRYAIGRVRDNAESVAFLGGDEIEKKGIMQKFKPVAENWYKIMKTNKRIGWFQSYYGTAADIVPFIIMTPAVMTGSMTYADLKLASIGFGRVDAGLNWFTNSIQPLAAWKATLNRLSTYDDAVDKSIAEAQNNIINIGPQEKHIPAPMGPT